jgi:hypothetical protein
MAGEDPSEVQMELLQRIGEMQENMVAMRESMALSFGYHETMTAAASLVDAADEIRRFAPTTVVRAPVAGTVDAIVDMRRALGLSTWMPTYDRPVVDIPAIRFIGEVIPPAMEIRVEKVFLSEEEGPR